MTNIVSVGAYLPKTVVTNTALSASINTTHEWIVERTGILQRHIASDSEKSSDMALIACEQALIRSGMSVRDIDLIVVATTTPDQTFPSTACILQKKLEVRDCMAFDIQSVCSGFVYALSVADSLIQAGRVNAALVVGADKMSSIVDWQDRQTCVLFGDGAGAVVLTQGKSGGLLDFDMHSDAALTQILEAKTCGAIRMDGRAVFRHASEKMMASIKAIMDRNSLRSIDWLIPHQANKRIIKYMAGELGLDERRIADGVEWHANTSAASIPLALSRLAETQAVSGTLIMTAAGAGFTWGSVLIDQKTPLGPYKRSAA